eukprot:9485983-Pyramimonas_sp.AAC.1
MRGNWTSKRYRGALRRAHAVTAARGLQAWGARSDDAVPRRRCRARGRFCLEASVGRFATAVLPV